MKLTIWTGRVEDVLPRLEPGTFDACLCDPPYGLSREPDVAEGTVRPTCPTCGAGRIATAPNGEKRCRFCFARWTR